MCRYSRIPFQELVHVGLKAGDDVIIDEAAPEFDDEASTVDASSHLWCGAYSLIMVIHGPIKLVVVVVHPGM